MDGVSARCSTVLVAWDHLGSALLAGLVTERRRRAQGEGSIYQLSDGRWRGSVELGWIGGKRRRRTITRSTKSAVGRDLRQLLAQQAAGQLNTDKAPTLAAWMETYLREVAPDRVRPATLASYQQQVHTHIVPELGHHRLDRLRPQHLAAFYRKRSEVLSASSIRRLHAILRRSLTIAVRWGVISSNPAQLVDPPALESSEVQPYSVAEVKRFLAAATSDRLESRWVVGITLGLRQGEVLGLSWHDIDFESRVLRIRYALRRQPDGSLVLNDTKNARGRRSLPLPGPVVESLLRRRQAQQLERAAAGERWVENGLVFTTSLGTPIHPRNDYRSFQRLLTRAGLRRIRLHDLRHTAASLLLTQGVPARVVMEILGHSQIGVTMNTYSHVAPELNRAAVQRIENALWPDGQSIGLLNGLPSPPAEEGPREDP